MLERCSRHIQSGEMKINDAIKLIEKYDDELNDIDLSETLNFLKLTRIEFFEIENSHRNNEIWKKKGIKLNLKNKPY